MLTRAWEPPTVVGRGPASILWTGSERPQNNYSGFQRRASSVSSSLVRSKSYRRGSSEVGVVILGPGPYRVDAYRESQLVATHSHPPGPMVPMPAPQPLLPLLFVFVLFHLTSETNLLPEPGSHPGMCPNQLSPHLWVDAQSTCERECTRDQVSTGISWDSGPHSSSFLIVGSRLQP